MVRETVRRRDGPASAPSSRLPRAIAETHGQPAPGAELPTISGGVDSSDAVRAALQSLGAPEMTRGEFARLYKGPLADVLRFVAEHVKGRAGVASARDVIQQMRDASKSKGPGRSGQGESSYDRAQAAAMQLSRAKSSLKSAQEAFEDRQRSIVELQRKADQLRSEVEEIRLDLLLLSVLEKKETLRGERFAEITVLLARLREEIQIRRKAGRAHESGILPERTTTPLTPINAESTRDILAALHAHHISVAHLASRSNKNNTNEKRLRSFVSSSMQLPEDDPQVIASHEKCLRVARIRATEGVRYRSPLDSSTTSTADLDDIAQRVAEKEQELQQLSDSSIAFGLSCAHSLQSMSDFSSTTAPALRASLRAEEAVVHGYVDVLRLSVANRERSAAPAGAHDALLLLGTGKSWDRTLSDVEDDLQQAHAKETFLRAASLRDSGADSAERETSALIDTYTSRQTKTDEQITKLLTRKLEKARVGDVLVGEIERLVAEVGIVASLSDSSALASVE